MNSDPKYLFPSKDGYDNKTFKFLYVHDLEGNFLYLSPEIESIIGEPYSFFLKKSYIKLLNNQEDNCQICKSNTYKTLEMFKEDKNAINSYEVSIWNFSTKQPMVCRLFEKVLYDVLPNDEIKILGIQGITTIADHDMDLFTNYYRFLLQKSQLKFACNQVINVNNLKEIVGQITFLFETHLQFINQFDDHWEDKGKIIFQNQVKFFVERNIPLELILPAFPFKSKNTEKKVLSHLPDKGERLGLETLNIFCSEIKKIYAPGAIISIVSDGRVFADIFKITDEHVTDYGAEIRAVALEKGYDCIKFFCLEDFLDKCETHDVARERLVSYFGRKIDDITKRIEVDEDYSKMYCGFTKFLLEDLYNFMENEKNSLRKKFQMSRTQMKKDAKERAKFVMMRNDAYSRMVGILFPLNIRLSIHAHNNSGPKFAIRLLPLAKISEKLISDKNLHIPTPWHNVVVEDKNGKFVLMKKFQVERHTEKVSLVLDKKGSPSHFIFN